MRAKVQVIMRHAASFAVITYTIPKKDTYVDIKIKMLSNDVNRMYKLSFDTAFNGAFMGQSSFGTEENMQKEEKEEKKLPTRNGALLQMERKALRF